MEEKKFKKNGELMNAVSLVIYFSILVFWLLSGIVIVVTSLIINILPIFWIGILELGIGFIVLAYLNRNVPSGDEI